MDSGEKQGLLYSLRYDTMNERFNRIELAHSGTFEWIFRQHTYMNSPKTEESEINVQQTRDSLGSGNDGEHATDGGAAGEGTHSDKPVLEAREGRQDPDSDEDTDVGSDHGIREDSTGSQGSVYCPDFDIPSFVQSSTENIYWITGKPGSGKSTLMKFMVEASRMQSLLKQVFPTCLSVVASHFIWAAGTSVQKSLRGILSSLLFQILSRDDEALNRLASQYLHNPQRMSLNDWSEQQLNEALQTVCSNSRNAVCVFIDGLDEIEPRDANKILKVIDDLSALPYTKCIVSSRPEEVFSRYFTRRGARYLSMQNFTQMDIRRYAMEELSESIHDSERLREVVKILCDKAEGVFLWVVLAVKGQRLGAVYKDSPELLARRLEKLPMGLAELYSDMWNRLNEDKDIYGEQGAKYLNLMRMPPTRCGGVLNFSTHLRMAFATQPALIRKSFQPSSLSFLEELEDIQEDHVVWIRVRTAGLIETETGESLREVEFIHRSAVEFLENTAKGLEITSLDKTTLSERRFSLLIADLAIVKWKCDVERLGRFVAHKYRRGYVAPRFDLCERVRSLEGVLKSARKLYEEVKIDETAYLEVLDYAAATHEAIGLVGDIYPRRRCSRFPARFSGDFLGFTARLGIFEYVSKKVEDLSTEREMCPSYLEYLWAETCHGIFQACSDFDSDMEQEEAERRRTMRQWLSTLQPKHSLASPTFLAGGHQRTTRGLVCNRFLGTILDFCTYQDIALQTEVCKTIFQDASSDYRVLFKIPWYKQVGESARSLVPTPYYNHIFQHREEFNIYVELPITLLVKFHNARISSKAVSVESYEDLLHRLPATTKETPMTLVIQSWIDTPYKLKAYSTSPEQYFLLEDEDDKQFVTTTVMREVARAAWHGSLRLQHLASSRSVVKSFDIESLVMNRINQIEFPHSWQATDSDLRGEALSNFVSKKIADNSLKLIGPDQFDDLLIERGHAFKPAPHSPWPPAKFDERGDLVPDQASDIKLDDTHEAISENNNLEKYYWSLGYELHYGVFDGDFLHSIRAWNLR